MSAAPKQTLNPIPSSQQRLSEYCHALSHPVRLEILKLLLNQGSCLAGDIAERFERSHSTVSEHLRLLKAAGLVSGTVEGPKRCYCACRESLEDLQGLLGLLLSNADCCLPMDASEKGQSYGTV